MVGRFHPVHFSLPSSHIGPRDVDRCSDRVFLGQLKSILLGESLDFADGVVSGVEANSSLGSSVGKMNGGAFEGHETGEGFDFSNIDIFSISGSSLGG